MCNSTVQKCILCTVSCYPISSFELKSRFGISTSAPKTHQNNVIQCKWYFLFIFIDWKIGYLPLSLFCAPKIFSVDIIYAWSMFMKSIFLKWGKMYISYIFKHCLGKSLALLQMAILIHPVNLKNLKVLFWLSYKVKDILFQSNPKEVWIFTLVKQK